MWASRSSGVENQNLRMVKLRRFFSMLTGALRMSTPGIPTGTWIYITYIKGNIFDWFSSLCAWWYNIYVIQENDRLEAIAGQSTQPWRVWLLKRRNSDSTSYVFEDRNFDPFGTEAVLKKNILPSISCSPWYSNEFRSSRNMTTDGR